MLGFLNLNQEAGELELECSPLKQVIVHDESENASDSNADATVKDTVLRLDSLDASVSFSQL